MTYFDVLVTQQDKTLQQWSLALLCTSKHSRFDSQRLHLAAALLILSEGLSHLKWQQCRHSQRLLESFEVRWSKSRAVRYPQIRGVS